MRFREVRETRGVTQAVAAAVLGVHVLTVSKWERGVLCPDPWSAAVIDEFTVAMENGLEGRILSETVCRYGVVAGLRLVVDAGRGLTQDMMCCETETKGET